MSQQTGKGRYVLALIGLQLAAVVVMLLFGQGLPGVLGALIGMNLGLLTFGMLAKRRKRSDRQ